MSINYFRKYLGILLFFFLGSSCLAQLKTLSPSKVTPLHFSVEEENAFNRVMEKLASGVPQENLHPNEIALFTKSYGEIENYWDLVSNACSWYCGGMPLKVAASSSLRSNGALTYSAQNAHDFNAKTAWVEGVPGYGIGEYLEYTFEVGSPRITEIMIINGYIKSKSAWEDNSRVKKMKVYINNNPKYIFELQDKRSIQTFSVTPIGYRSGGVDIDNLKRKKQYTIKFEILEVYKGLKYDDVVISDLYFDGMDVHCLAGDSKIEMADHSFKNIEDVHEGDIIVSVDDHLKTGVSRVEKINKVKHDNLVRYTFESGREITSTKDHPFKLLKKGWASLQPEYTKFYRGFEDAKTIKIGDVFISSSGGDKLIKITNLSESYPTYSISKLSSGRAYFANGLVVGAE